MKALMLGWEFPPHISGGLGTATYGITKGLSSQEDMDITLMLPAPSGDEDSSYMSIIGASEVPIVYQDPSREYLEERIGRVMSLEMYYHLRDHIYADFRYMLTDDIGCIQFSGKYGDNLIDEINNYSIVAGVVARADHYDLVHAHDWVTYPAGIHAKQVLGVPLVIHVHATDFDRSRGNVNPTVYAIEKDGMDHADHIMCVSELTRRTVIEKYHQDPAKVTAVHNAVIPLEESILNIPDKRGVKDKVITFLGRLTMQKGPEYFVEAAARVLAKKRDVRFVMAGSGDKMDEMIRLVAEKRISDRFHFTGFMKGRQVYEVYHASDVYVMPSVSEPFGITPLEAMQCGVPCIISKQSGCSEILTYAIKLDYWDVDAMADAMYALVTYPALHDLLSQRGLDEVAGITWDKVALKIRGLYDQVLGR
ncbi:glycosyltransferase family 4 protein [uncultured Porphyromonas sp.]|uniref:glycosyltransferase family 4 protein n=1 Tax=uncultured Porphyromonas sp. TaxID=159274 RepID=UPI0025D9B849|nr:glycosyltransferase family 4 protein [uncultured Porphyromonas sp.]